MFDKNNIQKWRPIEELGIEVSDSGNVRNATTGKWIRPHMTGHGYLRVGIKHHTFYVHRLVMEAFHAPCPQGMEVGHINNVPTDNRLENLQYVTSSQNKLHAVKSGTWPIGRRRWNAVLSEETVREIRRLRDLGWSIGQIAGKLNANFTTVYHVLKGHNWKHVR